MLEMTTPLRSAPSTPKRPTLNLAWATDATDAPRAEALGFDMLLVDASSAPPSPGSLPVLVDRHVGRVPAGSVPPVFQVLPAPLLDPREAPAPADTAIAAIAGPEDVATLATWWGQQIGALVKSGFSGVRLLGLAELPAELLTDFLVRLRAGCPGALLFAWAPGLPWGALNGLPPGTLDCVAASLPWWDGEAPWFGQELAALRKVAPVVLPAAAGLDAPVRHLAVAAAMAEGWLVPLAVREDELQRLNAARDRLLPGPSRIVSAPGAEVLALVQTGGIDARAASEASLVLVNEGPAAATIMPGPLLARLGRDFLPFAGPDGVTLDPLRPVELAPGALMAFRAEAPAPLAAPALDLKAAAIAAKAPRLTIEAPSPCVDAGRFPVRRIVGEVVQVEADIIADGHDELAAVLRWQKPGGAWQEAPMRSVVNDRWAGSFPLMALGNHHYTVQAWRDDFATFVDELRKKHAAGVSITLELQEGRSLVEAAAKRSARKVFAPLVATLATGSEDARREALLAPATIALMADTDHRPFAVELDRPVLVQAERTGAGFASWYEVFPRSLSDDPARHGTFRDVIRHLPRIRAMGFDVLYFPPIHPIGRKNRKGRNNTLTPAADDPGSPYAIGSEAGGHDALHPELGTPADFAALIAAARDQRLELALDFAIQCSPDHPWLRAHKDWFTWRPDGSIRYAENPPKKYEDIVNVDFYADGAVPGLWVALAEAVLHWAALGVRLFRVDNPHTKPLPFWEWMIAEVQARYPDTVFLAEAFTRPKVMYRLAKVGFSQSYTYFTWRETKYEFEQYLTELTQGPAREFFRPHFFVNTPDINPVYLQGAGRGSYLARAALAATLSGLWGVYNGFELCEGTPVPGKEEYLDSEKYQLRAWDWDRPGNIVAEITALNAIRRANPALHSHHGVTFLRASNDRVLWFEKATAARDSVVLVAISLDVSGPQTADVEIPFWRFTPESGALDVTDLLTSARFQWRDRSIRLTLQPGAPYALWRIQPAS